LVEQNFSSRRIGAALVKLYRRLLEQPG
jgi:hypothetical protein